ncbi:MAG: nitroreductase family protein [Candidatus Saccharibacteria bacterium]|nr:MAG: nitroreductase family protein [Candidatus Saccharibacteria bacterium]
MKQEIPSHISELLDYARLAPSAHNAQPWKFIVDGNLVSIAVELDRVLGPGDPTGRETWLSFGICLEAALQAAEGLGLNAELVSTQTSSLQGTIAVLKITTSNKPEQPAILSALKKRHTYREKMQPAEVPQSLIAQCQQAVADLEGVNVHFMQDEASIRRVGEYTFKAMSLALSSPDFRKELYHLVHYNWSPSRTGMHGYTLGEGMIGSIFGKLSIKMGIGLPLKARHDQQRVNDASALVFIGTTGDVPSFWLQAGRAYLRVALKIADSGLAQCTLAAPVEAASFHEDIEKMLGTSDRLQSMLRIGKPAHFVRSSPRLEVEELTT